MNIISDRLTLLLSFFDSLVSLAFHLKPCLILRSGYLIPEYIAPLSSTDVEKELCFFTQLFLNLYLLI